VPVGVTDEQRQRVIDELRHHCVAGRLDIDEYAARIEQALAATSLEDLVRVLGDLPRPHIAEPAGASGVPGNGYRRQASSTSNALAGAGCGVRLAASAVVLLSVMVVLAAVVLGLALSWAWAAVLLVGWLLGLVQARLSGRRR
jgi:hypothetical protein